MFDFIKELIKEPENAKKYALITTKFILIAFVTSEVYVHLFGNYTPIFFEDENFWPNLYNFFISGKALIVLFLFFGIKYFVFEFFSLLLYSLLFYIVNRITKKKIPDFLKGILLLFGVLSFSKEEKIIEAGKHFDFFYDFIIRQNKEEFISNFDNFRNSLLYEFFNIYGVFTLIYFLFLDQYQCTSLNLIVVFFLVFMIYFIASFQLLIEMLRTDYDESIFMLKLLKQISITKKLLADNEIKTDFYQSNSSINFLTFKINDVTYAIEHFFGRGLSFKNNSNLKLDENGTKILITSKKLPYLIRKKIKQDLKIKIIYFNGDENSLINKLENVFFKDQPA